MNQLPTNLLPRVIATGAAILSRSQLMKLTRSPILLSAIVLIANHALADGSTAVCHVIKTKIPTLRT